MAASQISTPNVGTVDLATDEIAARHFQGTKVYGGGEGVANELFVSATGELVVVASSAGFFGSKPIGEVAYADKALIGGLVPIATNQRQGLYTLERIALLFADFVTPAVAPDPMPPVRVAILAVAAGTDVSAIDVDGLDATTFPLTMLSSFQWIPETILFEESPIANGFRSSFPGISIIFSGDAPEDLIDVYAVFIADGAIATDYTALSIGAAGYFAKKAGA